MEIKNALKPNHEQMENFNSGDLDTPIFFGILLSGKSNSLIDIIGMFILKFFSFNI